MKHKIEHTQELANAIHSAHELPNQDNLQKLRRLLRDDNPGWIVDLGVTSKIKINNVEHSIFDVLKAIKENEIVIRPC